MEASERNALIERIRDFPSQLEAMVHNLSDDDLFTPYLDGEWTVAQIIHHIADGNINLYTRIKLCITEDQPTIKTVNINEWANLPDADMHGVQASLEIVRGLHDRLYITLCQLPAGTFERTFNHPMFGIGTLDNLVKNYSRHGYSHIEQIKQTLAAKSSSHNEPH